MKSLMLLLQWVASDEAAWCRTSTVRDLKTISDRVEHEGMSFLTITLPAFCKELERSLDEGKVAPDAFTGFGRCGKRGGIPNLFGGFLEQVFDSKTGELLDEPSTDAIRAVRQITLLFSKVELECAEKRVTAAFDSYVETDMEVRASDQRISEEKLLSFQIMADVVWGQPLRKLEKALAGTSLLIPKHGPGATADRLVGNDKYSVREWPERLDEVFPYLDYALPNHHFWNEVDRVDFLSPGAERPVKVISVPKTMKTPRIIAVEPTAMQYMQQAIKQFLVSELESDNYRYNWLVGFEDQSPNRDMALEGSLSGELATLDLSEASDRVSNRHVQVLTANNARVAAAFDATRSRKAYVKGYGEITLAKYASMGSALTFPIEAMVFATVILLGIQKAQGSPLTPKQIDLLKGQVRVYGDDIIVPVKYVHEVMSELQSFGYVVNLSKSFWTGKFRESCGKEYYNGADVSVVKCRRVLPNNLQDAREIVSLVSFRNQLYSSGRWMAMEQVDSMLQDILRLKGRSHYPVVAPTSPVLGSHSYVGYHTDRMHGDYQSPLVKGFVVSTKLRQIATDGYAALQKVFLKRGEEPFADVKHLERSGRPLVVDIKLRMASPF